MKKWHILLGQLKKIFKWGWSVKITHPPRLPKGFYKAGRSSAIRRIQFPSGQSTGILRDYERKLLAWRVKVVKKLQNAFNNLETSINELIHSFSENEFKDNLSEPARHLERSYKKEKSDIDVLGSIKEFKEEQKTLWVFVQENHLLKLPKNAHKKGFIHFWVLFILFTIEAILNGSLFVPAIGLLPGLAISLPAAAINVIGGWMIGRYTVGRALYHPQIILRPINYLVMAAYATAVVYLNFALGVLRSRAEEHDAALLDAVRPIDYLGSLDAPSAIFIGVGFVFAIIALIDGLQSDDLYPGYGAAWRKCSAAREKAVKKSKLLRKKIHKAWLDAERKHKKANEELRHDIDTWSSTVNQLQRGFQDYQDCIADAERLRSTAQEQFNQGYRDNNGTPREETITPLFSDELRNPRKVFADVEHSCLEDQERVSRAGKYVEVLNKAHGEQKSHLQELIENLLNEVNSIEIPPMTIAPPSQERQNK